MWNNTNCIHLNKAIKNGKNIASAFIEFGLSNGRNRATDIERE